MDKLAEIASVLRSKNAGPLNVTLDIMFPSEAEFLRVSENGVLTPQRIAELYGVPEEAVQIIPYAIVHSLKITIPRRVVSGAVGDDDVYGCQQQYALAELRIP